jgi:glycosyltransferase involved in cell wall biosynthesis
MMTADTVGGVWTYALELSRGLVAHGVEVLLATMGAPVQPAQRAQAAEVGPALQLHESAYRLEWMQEPWADVAAAGEWLLGLARAFAPDVIHLNGYVHAALPWRTPCVVVAHSCVFSWWEAVHGTPPPPEWNRYHAAVGAGLSAADLVVAPTHAMLAALSRHYGAVPRGRVIWNGRDPAPSAPGGARTEAVLSVGRLWDEAKNAAALVAIAPQLPGPVRLAGDARAPDGRERPLSNVERLGVRTSAQLAADYAQAAIFALPARYEPFGLAVLEAAQAGCALVLGHIPSLRELWSGAAVFVGPNDHRALRVELTALLRDPARRSALARRARERARRYSAARMISAYLEAYTDLLPGSRRRFTLPAVSCA